MDGLLHQFLLRLGELRVGEPFGRPQVQPALTREVFERLAPGVFGLSALALGGGSLLWWARAAMRRRRSEASALRALRAEALAEITRLSALLVTVEIAARDAAGTRLLADAAVAAGGTDGPAGVGVGWCPAAARRGRARGGPLVGRPEHGGRRGPCSIAL
ncbi:hypothetical protein [Actinoalloteichus sp. GBA129-24]|uniref:hypothetical protein n=1 Tax=Actinoalloteichus sp. GBA129-24 TaxID=1612551 RepID=UPI0012F8CFB6|nr:hypothetical protein [Actinoalloteichus sp. GBA129-24]